MRMSRPRRTASGSLALLLVMFGTVELAQSQEIAPRKGLDLPANFNPKGRAIVFVHGLGSSHKAAFARFAENCSVDGIQAISFEYPNHGSLGEAGQKLGAALREFEAKHPKSRVAVVAHSMGGLVARYALEIARPTPTSVTDLFTLGTPHDGSLVAEYGHILRLGEGLLQFTSPSAFFAEGRGEACVDLTPGSALLRELIVARPAPGLKYHVINGSRAVFTEAAWARQVEEFRRITEHRLGRSPKDVDRLGAAFAQMDEVVHGKGDGAVAIRRAKLAAACSDRTFELGHLELTRSPTVWAHILETLKWRKRTDSP